MSRIHNGRFILYCSSFNSASIHVYLTAKKEIRTYWNDYNTTIKKILNELKINGCAICGYNKCMQALDFHHANPRDKKFGINMAGTLRNSNEKIAKELNKCILLCSNCHREIHRGEKE